GVMGQLDSSPTAGQVVPDQDHRAHARFSRTSHHLVTIPVEGSIHQVGVCVHHFWPRHGTGAFAPPMTRVNSPRGACSEKCASADAAVPRKTSSKRLVSSRATAMGRPVPTVATRSFKLASTRYGDSKTINVASLSAWRWKNFFRAAVVRGRNPRKQKAWVGRPPTMSAAITLDGPGTGTTSWPAESAS